MKLNNKKSARLIAPLMLAVFAAMGSMSSAFAASPKQIPSPTEIAEGAALVTSASAQYPMFNVVLGIVLLGGIAFFVALLVLRFAKRGTGIGR